MKFSSKLTPLRWRWLLLTLLCGCLHPASAQKLEFSCVTWDKLPFKEVYFRNGEEAELVTIGKGFRAKLHEQKNSDGPFQLFIKHIDDDGNESFKLVGQTSLPASKDVLILIDLVETEPDSENLPLRLFAMDDSKNSFPANSFRFVNFSIETVFVRFQDEHVKLAPKKLDTITGKAPKKGGFVPFQAFNSNTEIVAETRLFAQPRGRTLVMLLPPKKQGARMHMRYISQLFPPSSSPTEDE